MVIAKHIPLQTYVTQTYVIADTPIVVPHVLVREDIACCLYSAVGLSQDSKGGGRCFKPH